MAEHSHTAPHCRHGHGCGYLPKPVYPEQEQLKPGEMWCYECESVVPDPIEVQRRHAAAQPCLRDDSGDTCRGTVTARPSFAGTGLTIYECEHHMAQSWRHEEETRRRYPAQQPHDFDPLFAGESWYGDDY